jgi:hypothetical protein
VTEDISQCGYVSGNGFEPDNMKLKPDGMVKVLDFGLAKVAEAAVAASSPEASRRGPVYGLSLYRLMGSVSARGVGEDLFGARRIERLKGFRTYWNSRAACERAFEILETTARASNEDRISSCLARWSSRYRSNDGIGCSCQWPVSRFCSVHLQNVSGDIDCGLVIHALGRK